jgi:hypothetical protein
VETRCCARKRRAGDAPGHATPAPRRHAARRGFGGRRLRSLPLCFDGASAARAINSVGTARPACPGCARDWAAGF